MLIHVASVDLQQVQNIYLFRLFRLGLLFRWLTCSQRIRADLVYIGGGDSVSVQDFPEIHCFQRSATVRLRRWDGIFFSTSEFML